MYTTWNDGISPGAYCFFEGSTVTFRSLALHRATAGVADALADPDAVALPDTAGVPETDGVADALGLPDAEPLTDPEGATVEGVGRALKFWKGSPVAVASAAASS